MLKATNWKILTQFAVGGGLFKHIPSGTYLVNDAVIRDIKNPPYGEHAANLGAYLAKELGDKVGIPAFFVDPVCVRRA